MQAKTQHRQWRNISMEVEATLNVGCCILPQNATEKSISSFRSTNENSNDTDSTDNINNIKENTRPVTRECNKSVAECVSPIQKLMECISAQREELFSDKVTDSQGTVQENKATQTFNENTKNAEAVHISSISLPPRINVQNKVLANNDSKLHFLNTPASPSTNVATNEIHVDQLSQNVAPGSDATEKIENFLTRHNVPKVKPNGHSVIQNTDINIKEQKSFLKSANGKDVYTNGGNSLNELEIHKTCMDSSSVHKSSFQTRNDKDSNIEEDLHSSSSSSTVISGYSLSQRRGDIFTDSNSMNSSTTASSGSVKIVFKLTEQHYDEVENHTAKNSQFEESYSIPVATAYDDGIKSSKNQKHCKKHCLKQHICTFPEDKVKNSEKFVHDNTYSRLIDESKLKSADNSEQVVHSDMKSDKNVTKSHVYGLHEYNNKNIVSDSRKRKQWQDSFSKNLDMSTNPTSASTSYFSPPEKISATGAEEIESLFGTIKSSEKYLNVNDVKNGPQISLGSYEKQNPNLACYIRRLLKMSRESVEDLSISSNEVSSQTGEILNTVMDNRSSYLQDSNLFSNKVCTPTKSDGESEEEFLKALLCKVKKQTKENVIRSSTRSQCEECEKTNGSLHSHQTYDTLDGGKNSCNEGNLKGHQSLGNICEHKDPLEKFNSSVNEQLLATLQSNNLVAAMNQRIISALNEINSVIDQVPSYASSPELPQPKTVSPTLPEVELNELAEKYSRRIMELTKKIENVRQEKQQILESSSSGSDKAKFGDSTVYMSPPTANQDQRLPENLLGQGLTTSKMDTTSMRTNSESFGEQLATSVYNSAVNKNIRLKPPATLSQKLSRNGVLTGTPHELSTIMEIDSTQISQSRTAFGCKSATNAGPSAEASRDPVISNGTLESDDHKLTAENPSSSDSLLETSNKDQHLTSDSVESITEIVAEMLRRNLLSSPYSWMEEDKIKKANSAESKIVLPTSHENIPQNERSNAGCEIEETDDVQLDIQNSSDSVVGIDDHENHRDIRTNVSQSDLHGMFQKLGIGWASSMLRKTQESMAYSSSSSDNTPVAASQLPRKDVLRDNTRISENKPNNAKKIHSIKGGIPSPSFAQESVMLIAGHSTPVGLDSEGSSTKQPNFSVTGESEISIIRPEFCNDESLDIKAPNVSLVPKLKFTNHSAESSS